VYYAGLFLLAGIVLLAITYGLLASSLPPGTTAQLTQNQQTKAIFACKALQTRSSNVHLKQGHVPSPKPGVKVVPVPEARACQAAFSAGANADARSQRDQTLHDLLLYSILGLGAVTIVSASLGWLMAGRALRPVTTITAAARRASEGHLGERLNLQGPEDELKVLADTFDYMLDRLDRSFASQRRFVADASHELRMPLTVMRTSIEVTLAKPNRTPEQMETMARRALACVAESEALIGSLLLLAQGEQELTNLQKVDLSGITSSALASQEPEIRRHELRVTTDLQAAAVLGEPRLLESLVGNLVDNAVRHNVRDGWVHIVTSQDDETARLEISNTGPVIDDEVVQDLFQPFRRVEERTKESTEGFGLGLAIVNSIALAHGASLNAHARVGGGLVVSVAIPRRSGEGSGDGD